MRNLLPLLLALLGTACAFDHKKGREGTAVAGELLTRPVPYSEVFQAVIAPRCVSCHSEAGGNQGKVNLETYESTFPQANAIQKAAVKEKTMPKSSPLTEGEEQLLASWLAQGASRNGGPFGNPKLKEAPAWLTIRNEIFERKCLDCHMLPHPEKNLDLSSLEQVKANAGKIFDRAVVLQDMPLQPYERLTTEEKQALANWIALGMPE